MSVPFKIYDCDFGITVKNINYDFEHVQNLAIEDPESTKLVRGANAGNKTGLIYKEGLKEPKKVTVTIIGMSMEMHNLLKQVYIDRSRLDCYCVSRVDGSSKIAKNAILSQEPKQLSVDESTESLNTALIFESFDITEVYKS